MSREEFEKWAREKTPIVEIYHPQDPFVRDEKSGAYVRAQTAMMWLGWVGGNQVSDKRIAQLETYLKASLDIIKEQRVCPNFQAEARRFLEGEK